MVERFWQSNSNCRSDAEIEILTGTADSFAGPNWVSKWLVLPLSSSENRFSTCSLSLLRMNGKKGLPTQVPVGTCRVSSRAPLHRIIVRLLSSTMEIKPSSSINTARACDGSCCLRIAKERPALAQIANSSKKPFSNEYIGSSAFASHSAMAISVVAQVK